MRDDGDTPPHLAPDMPEMPKGGKPRPKGRTQSTRLAEVEDKLRAVDSEVSTLRVTTRRIHTLSLTTLALVAIQALVPRLLTLLMVVAVGVACGAVVVRVLITKEPAVTAAVRVLASAWRVATSVTSLHT